MHERDARPALVDASQRLEAAGLNHNSSGNLSVRVDDHVLVTPSGIPAHVLRPDDLVLLDADGAPVDDRGRVRTSEWQLHVLLLRQRPDVEAVVHTHSPEASAAAALGRAVPAVHYVVARFGGTELPCAPYATYGTEELAHNVATTLGRTGTACLMANHGAVTLGRDLGSAVSLALDLEWLCGVHRRACQLGTPQVLDDDEIARVAERFSRYGQPGR
jgi:ribulose-5-phosphate 4-epimerase/fuculose-1-phosphate aldolase